MARQNRYFVFFLFAFISLVNTAFILKDSKQSTQNLPSQSLEAPPQYNVQKLPFFENKVLRKIRNNGEKPIDLKKIAKQSTLFGGISHITGLVSLCVVGVSPPATLLMLALTLMLAIIAVTKAKHVEENPLSTNAQKDKARKGKISGCLGFMAVLLCLIFAVVLFPNIFL